MLNIFLASYILADILLSTSRTSLRNSRRAVKLEFVHPPEAFMFHNLTNADNFVVAEKDWQTNPQWQMISLNLKEKETFD